MPGRIEIHINQLGPIHDTDITLKPFMVFTGESGTGKSYAALLVHYVYKILCTYESAGFFKSIGASYDKHREQLPDENEGFLFEFTLKQFEEWCNKNAVRYIGESLGNFSLDSRVDIKFLGLEENYKFKYKRDIVEMDGEVSYFDSIQLNDLPSLRLPYRSKKWDELPYMILFRNYMLYILRIKQKNTFILPPSRGGLVCLNDVGRGNFLNSKGWMYNEFISDFSNLKSAKPNEEVYTELSDSLINGKINIKDDDLYYEQAYGEIPITATAASVKELAPFALMLQKGLVGEYSIMFEEPETNLHPELQIKTADTLAYLLQKGCRFQITTHSDYFLQRINQLIKLGKLKKKGVECQSVFSSISDGIYIKEEKIAAYYFEKIDKVNTTIKPLEIGKNGIPFSTFFETVKKLSDEENRINNLLDTTYGC